ncbi:MAG: hypothetical protein JW969_14890 [Spirochaetales bacterium]|nr:hypothetical protein [Spirochaetales bacterium]
MITDLINTGTLIVFVLFILVYFRGGASITADIKHSKKSTGSFTGTIIVLILSVMGLALLAGQVLIAFKIISIPFQNDYMSIFGFILFSASVVTVCYIRFVVLGKFWAGNVRVHEDQKIIEDGAYKLVRHPLYAMTFPQYIGIGLIYPVWWMWVICGILLVGYVILAAYEDSFLERNLQGYSDFQRRTRYRMVPGLW